MLKRIIFIFLLSIAGIIYFSCKHESLDPIDVGYKYYPSNVGHWVMYEVDSTYYDGFTHTVRKYHFKINEKIESTFLDNQNRPTQRIERYKKATDTTNWFLKDVWASNLTSTTAEKVEENVRYVKLVFPIIGGQTWNGNALNDLGSQDYEYDNVFEPYSINGFSFDSTVTVIQNKDTNLIHVSDMVEIYAKNVGLIYKKYKDVNKEADPLHDSITSGVDYTYRIISFGN